MKKPELHMPLLSRPKRCGCRSRALSGGGRPPRGPRPHDVICQTRTRNAAGADATDGGYAGEAFAQWVKTLRPQLEVAVVKRTDQVQGFKVLSRRWVVERTFGWLMRHRRLVRDYETTESSAEA